jgi:hypothetical protein
MFFSGLDFPDHMAIYIWAHLEAFQASDHVLTVSGRSESLQQRRDSDVVHSDVLKERFFMLQIFMAFVFLYQL